MGNPRNKIARLPVELRLLVAERLADGKTYETIQGELKARGVSAEMMPGLNAFTAYQKGKEYQAQIAELLGWKRKAAEKKQLAEALALGGGAMGILDLAIYEAAESLRDGLRGAEDAAGVAKAANALRGLKAVILAEGEQRRKADAAAAAAKIETIVADDATPKEEKLKNIREMLGL